MSSYTNSKGVEHVTWGLEKKKELGYDVNTPTKGKTLFQRFFGVPKHNTSGLENLVKRGKANTRRNNGGVPKFNFGPTKFFRKTEDFISPNNGNTLKTRLITFEQNFIKRLYAMYQDANFGKAPLDLSKYAEQLEGETNESKAILLYNELIVLYILFAMDSIDALYWENRSAFYKYLTEKGDIKTIEYFNDFERLDRPIAYIVSNMLLFGGIFTGLALAPITFGATAIPAGVLAFIYIFTIVTGVGSAFGLNLIAIDCILPRRKTNYWAEVGRLGQGAESRVDVFKYINLILFSPKNRVPITDVKDKLRYWGLLQTQVDYMFKVGKEGMLKAGTELKQTFIDLDSDMMTRYLGKMLRFFDKAKNTENFTLAPNEPFSEELLREAYPKSPLAGNPFANSSTLPRPPVRPLKSMTGGLTRRRVNKMSRRKYRR